MQVDTTSCGTVAIVIPHGALVTDDVPAFQQAVETASRERAGRIVIDLSDVPYFDSAGIQTLLTLYREPYTPSVQPKLSSLTETCQETLDLTNVLSRLVVFDTVENAVRSYNQ